MNQCGICGRRLEPQGIFAVQYWALKGSRVIEMLVHANDLPFSELKDNASDVEHGAEDVPITLRVIPRNPTLADPDCTWHEGNPVNLNPDDSTVVRYVAWATLTKDPRWQNAFKVLLDSAFYEKRFKDPAAA